LRYKYRLHENIVVEEDKTHEIENINIFINDIKDIEHKLRTYNRHKKDIEFLLLDYKENPNDPRTLYFLAFTSFLLDRYDESLKYYELLRKLNNPMLLLFLVYNNSLILRIIFSSIEVDSR
jgi:tetratricopeptide (TPR) repeat protein